MSELLLAIDIGTSSSRCLIINPDGNTLAIARARTVSSYPAPGRVEQDANLVWEQISRLLVQAMSDANVKPSEIAAIGITSQRSSIVIWDRRTTEAVVPMVIWSDQSGSLEASKLVEAGFISAPQMASSKLEATYKKAMQATGYKNAADIRRLAFGNIDSYIIFKLTGGKAHITDSSQLWAMGYLDLVNLNLNENLIQHQHLPLQLFPQQVDTWGTLAMTSKESFGAEVLIGADIADQQCAMVAHNCHTPGRCKITYGTSGTLNVSTGQDMRLVSDSVLPLIQYKNGDDLAFCLEGMVNTVGTTLDWLAGDLGIADKVSDITAVVSGVDDSDGVWVLPSLLGVGAPHNLSEGRMIIGGLSPGSTPANILVAALEGIAFRIREIFEHIYDQADVPDPGTIGVDGGAASIDRLLQCQADTLGRTVGRHHTLEATAFGAAICAGMGAEILEFGDLDRFSRYSSTYEPSISSDQADSKFQNWKTAVYRELPTP